MEEKVRKVIDEIRPSLQDDGGDVELLGVSDEGTVKLRLKGACGCCAMSKVTLHEGIERILKERVPEVKKVEEA